jgi:hypothetical protein
MICGIGDIWSENGISLFCITGYRICKDFLFHEDLLCAEKFSEVAHTGENIRKMTCQQLHDKWGIGTSPETALDRIHGCTPDEGANMLKGWEGMEGGGCVCHRQQTCLKHALAVPEVSLLVKKVKGICGHFNRSDKVIIAACSCSCFVCKIVLLPTCFL